MHTYFLSLAFHRYAKLFVLPVCFSLAQGMVLSHAQETAGMLSEEDPATVAEADAMQNLIKRLEETEERLNMLEWERQRIVDAETEKKESESRKKKK